MPPQDPVRLSLIHAYLRQCFDSESPPSVKEFAVTTSVSRVTLQRRFKTLYGMDLSRYLKRSQIAKAKELLRDTDLTTTAIAYRTAFSTRRTFYRAFLRETGTTPDRYRRGTACHPYPNVSIHKSFDATTLHT